MTILLLSGLLCAGSAFAAELAPRKDMSALDRAKVQSVMSKRWLGFGSTQKTTDTDDSPGVSRSSIGSTICTTNVGVPQLPNGASSGRYGPSAQKDNIVVVTGDIISVCK